jgi:Cu+-exporting ATPase
MAIDPVCGMTVDEQKAPATAVHEGTTYYFCAPGCKRTFEKDPAAILKGGQKGMASPPQMVTMMPPRTKPTPASAKAASQAKPTSLTIPIEGMSCASCVAKIEHGLSEVPGVLHASVNLATEKATVEYQPGVADLATIRDAIRGLGYTPVVPAAHETETPASKEARKQAAYRALRARFWFAAALTVPVMILGMSEHLRLPISQPVSFWLQLLLTTPIQFWAGWQFYKGAWAVARHGTTDMNTLIAVGTTAAYGYSVAATLAPGIFTAAGAAPQV